MMDLLSLQMLLQGGGTGYSPQQPQQASGMPMLDNAFGRMTGGGVAMHQGLGQSPIFAASAYRDTPQMAPEQAQYQKTLGGTSVHPDLMQMPILGATGIKEQNWMDKMGGFMDGMDPKMRLMFGLGGASQLMDALRGS